MTFETLRLNADYEISTDFPHVVRKKANGRIIKEYVENNPYTNLYLAPLSSKPQALGMALFFLWEKGYEKNISIIYPMCKDYLKDNSEGIARIWRYSFILPAKN